MVGKSKVLIIDDEKDFVDMLTIRLEANGYEVNAAFDGNQGVVAALKDKPDLIILDIMMPAGDGYFVCQKLKMSSFTWSIPIIFLTARDRPEDRERAHKMGAKFYLTKPYEPDILLDTIKNALNSFKDEGIEQIPLQTRRPLILIIEKDSKLAESIKSKLKDCDYDAMVEHGIERALVDYKEQIPDLIIVNGKLAEANDYKGFYRLKAKYALEKVPFVMLTTKKELDSLKNKLKYINGFLSKPINHTELLNQIKSILK